MSVSVTTAGDHVIVVQVFPKGEEPAYLQPIDSKPKHKPLVQPESKSPKEENLYPASQQKSLGVIQIMSGLLTAAMGIALLFGGMPLLFPPMWTGAVCIISGALCVSVGVHKGNCPCLLKGTLAMNIICALMAGISIIFICPFLAESGTYQDRYSPNLDYDSHSYSRMHWDSQSMRWRFLALMSGIVKVLLVLAILQFSMAVTASVLIRKAIRLSSGGTQFQSHVTVPTAPNVDMKGVKPLLSDVPNCPPPAYDA